MQKSPGAALPLLIPAYNVFIDPAAAVYFALHLSHNLMGNPGFPRML